MVTKFLIAGAAFLLPGMLAVSATAAPAMSPAALGAVRPGLWTLKMDGAGAVPQRLCVSDPAMLAQVRHPGNPCSRLVIADKGRAATIHYSCPGAGWGRTSVRVASATSVYIDTQGIADNAPFAYRAEAHRAGACRR